MWNVRFKIVIGVLICILLIIVKNVVMDLVFSSKKIKNMLVSKYNNVK